MERETKWISPLEREDFLKQYINYLLTQEKYQGFDSYNAITRTDNLVNDDIRLSDYFVFYNRRIQEWRKMVYALKKEHQEKFFSNYGRIKEFLEDLVLPINTVSEVQKIEKFITKDPKVKEWNFYFAMDEYGSIKCRSQSTNGKELKKPMFRIYVNIPFSSQYAFLELFIEKAKEQKIAYDLKYGENGNVDREGTLVFYTNSKYLYLTTKILEEIYMERKDLFHPQLKAPLATAKKEGYEWMGIQSAPKENTSISHTMRIAAVLERSFCSTIVGEIVTKPKFQEEKEKKQILDVLMESCFDIDNLEEDMLYPVPVAHKRVSLKEFIEKFYQKINNEYSVIFEAVAQNLKKLPIEKQNPLDARIADPILVKIDIDGYLYPIRGSQITRLCIRMLRENDHYNREAIKKKMKKFILENAEFFDIYPENIAFRYQIFK